MAWHSAVSKIKEAFHILLWFQLKKWFVALFWFFSSLGILVFWGFFCSFFKIIDTVHSLIPFIYPFSGQKIF